MSLLLRMAVLAAALWAAAALAAMLLRSRALTLRVRFARPAGRVSKGIRYALVEGMAPGAKESVRAHLGTWAAGVAYHLGLACAFLLLGSCTLAVPLPALIIGCKLSAEDNYLALPLFNHGFLHGLLHDDADGRAVLAGEFLVQQMLHAFR